MTSITWAGPRCVQELATFLGPQNRTLGRCDGLIVAPHHRPASSRVRVTSDHVTELQLSSVSDVLFQMYHVAMRGSGTGVETSPKLVME